MDLRGAQYGIRRLRSDRNVIVKTTNVCWQCSIRQSSQVRNLPSKGYEPTLSPTRRPVGSSPFSSFSPARVPPATATARDTGWRPPGSSPRVRRTIGAKLFSPRKKIWQDISDWDNEHRVTSAREAEEQRKAERESKPVNPLLQLIQGQVVDSDSVEDQEHFYTETNDDADQFAPAIPKPGDLLGFREDGRVNYGIYVQRIDNVSCQVVSLHGRNGSLFYKHIKLLLPGFVERSMVDDFLHAMPIQPRTPDLRSSYEENALMFASRPILQKLALFERKLDRVYRQSSRAMDNKIDILCDERYSLDMSLDEATRKLLDVPELSDVSDEQRWAVWREFNEGRAMSHDTFAKGAAEATRTILSKRDLEILDLVTRWWYEYTDYCVSKTKASKGADSLPSLKHRFPPASGAHIIADFIKSARAHILATREKRPISIDAMMQGPSKSHDQHQPSFIASPRALHRTVYKSWSKESWTLNEIVIIRFLEILGVRRMLGDGRKEGLSTPHKTVAIGIVKALDVYPENLLYQVHMIRMCLRELGVLNPYASPWSFLAPLPHAAVDPRLDLAYNHARISVKPYTSPNYKGKSKPNLSVDSMSHMRKDWGTMNVYCVDSATTRDVDDGISIEPVPGDTSQVWLHVHVAHPTAMFDRSHALEKCAMLMGASYYGPTGVVPMLPTEFTSSYASLRADSRCLTFSCLFTREGKLLDHKITPGIIRNVHFLTTQTWDHLVKGTEPGEESPQQSSIFVGPNKPPKEEVAPLRNVKEAKDFSLEQTEELIALAQLMHARQGTRTSSFGIYSPDSFDSFFDMQGVRAHYHGVPTIDRTNKRIIEGDPTIEVIYNTTPDYTREALEAGKKRDSHNAVAWVAEAMVSVCTVAAIWCGKRDVPVLYRHTHRDPSLPSPQEYTKSVVKPLLQSGQEISFEVGHGLTMSLGSITTGLVQKSHDALQVDGFVQVTSPLRRYADLLAHFQIDSVLKSEFRAAGSKKTTVPPQLAYTRQEMHSLMTHLHARQGRLKSLSSAENEWWKTLFVSHAFHFDQIKLPRLTGVLYPPNFVLKTVNPTEQFTLINYELSMPMQLIFDETVEDTRAATAGGNSPQLLDVWEVEVVDVRVEDAPMAVLVKPKRFITRLKPEDLAFKDRVLLQSLKDKVTVPIGGLRPFSKKGSQASS